MASRTIRNTTGGDIFLDDIGVRIPAGVTIDIPASDTLLWYRSSDGGDAESFLQSGNLVVNDSQQDLDPDTALGFLQLDQVRVSVGGTPVLDRAKVINFIGATGETGPGGEIGVQNIFGSFYQEERDNTLQTVTGTTTPQPVLTLTTPSLPAGQYRFAVEYRASANNQNANVIAQVFIDGTPGIPFFAFSLDPTTPAVTYASSEIPFTAGVHTIVAGVAPDNVNREAILTNVLLEIWRVDI